MDQERVGFTFLPTYQDGTTISACSRGHPGGFAMGPTWAPGGLFFRFNRAGGCVSLWNSLRHRCVMAVAEATMAPKPHSQPRPGPRQSPGAGVLLCGLRIRHLQPLLLAMGA
jgi:hypothetical protein